MSHRETISPPSAPAPVYGLDVTALAETLAQMHSAAEGARVALRASRHPLRVRLMRRLLAVRSLAGKSLTELQAMAGDGLTSGEG